MQDDSDLPVDIWITDISLKVVDVLSEEDKAGYSLTLVASEGKDVVKFLDVSPDSIGLYNKNVEPLSNPTK